MEIPVWFRDIFHNQTSNLLLDICGLVTNRDFSQSWQVDQCQIQNIRAEYLQVNRKTINPLVHPGDPCCFSLYFPSYSIEVGKSVSRGVKKLCPFWFDCGIRRIGWCSDINELKNERTTGDNAGTARKKIPPDCINCLDAFVAMNGIYRYSLIPKIFLRTVTLPLQPVVNREFPFQECYM